MVELQDLKTTKKNTWCPGCGNFAILNSFKRALIQLGLDREEVVAVTGIGCHGKITGYVNINGLHTIHGRVLPTAAGIKFTNPSLTVVGFSGDADCYDEGGSHFSQAIRRNLDLTLIVHDNKVLGLTTGQTTATSQLGFKTKSTPFGSTVPPFNPLANALVNHAMFVARGFSGELKHLISLMVEAIKHKGFALIDVLQPCVTFNYLNTYEWYRERVYKLEDEKHDKTNWDEAFAKTLEWGDRIPIGIFYHSKRPTFYETKTHLKGKSLIKQPLDDIDIRPLMKEFT